MSAYGVLMVLFLATASIVGMIVFLTQFRARRTVAMIALVATMFTVLALCIGTVYGVSFVARPIGGTMP